MFDRSHLGTSERRQAGERATGLKDGSVCDRPPLPVSERTSAAATSLSARRESPDASVRAALASVDAIYDRLVAAGELIEIQSHEGLKVEAAPGEDGEQTEEYQIAHQEVPLSPAEACRNRPGHEQCQSTGGDRHHPGRDVADSRKEKANGTQELDCSDRLQLTGTEVVDPVLAIGEVPVAVAIHQQL